MRFVFNFGLVCVEGSLGEMTTLGVADSNIKVYTCNWTEWRNSKWRCRQVVPHRTVPIFPLDGLTSRAFFFLVGINVTSEGFVGFGLIFFD